MAKSINKKSKEKEPKKINPFQGFLKPSAMRVRYLHINYGNIIVILLYSQIKI